jgi:hypothetical protein
LALYWISQGLQKAQGAATPAMIQAEHELAAGLAALGFVISAGIGYWFGDSAREGNVEGAIIAWDPAPLWACPTHPQQSAPYACFGPEWGCTMVPMND